MLDLIRDILKSDAGSFSFILSILLIIFWLIHWVTKKMTTINSGHGELTKGFCKIDGHIDEMRKDLSYLKGSVDIIRSGANPLTQSNSPVTLTEKGLDIARKIKADEIIAQNWDKIFNDLEENICDKNAYDIQEYCIDTASVEPEEFFDKETLLSLKNFAYNEGRPLQYYSGMLGVLIRDKYLKIKGIDVSEVDANDPNIKTPAFE